ncbi:MAG: hypothetical protein CXR30_00490 [Geobacter sp.]|nr:MAG: hypothetical protein CXR30_00490 [Geobacter sp.]
MPHIIAIAGPVGSGKTSLTRVLAQCLDDAATLYFDDYERITHNPAGDLVQWLQQGADINSFVIPGLADDLARLKQGESIVHPATGATLHPRKYIIFEMPLGKEHGETAPFIDLVLWIDLPADLALTRKLREYTGDFLARPVGNDYRSSLAWLHNYLDNYQLFIGDVLAVQRERIAPHADLRLDGRDAPERMAQQAAAFVRATLP